LRSIAMIVHELVRRVAPAFLEKYLGDEPGVLDPSSVKALGTSVLARRGRFYENSWTLMECMVIAIFVHQCRHPGALDFASQRMRSSGPPLIEPGDWAGIRKFFSDDLSPLDEPWQGGDLIALPEGAEMLRPLDEAQANRVLLIVAGAVTAQVTLPEGATWLNHFLRHVGRGAASGFTVDDWLEELEVDPQAFHQALDALYLSGFILKAPVRRPSIGRAGGRVVDG
jgi:hypothetical protein